MPLYDFKCSSCDNEWELFSPVADKDHVLCLKCGEFGVTQITCKSAPEVYGHYEPGLGSYIGSKSDETRIKKEKHLEELSPRETISTTHAHTRENEIKQKQANDYIKWYSADNA
jgi:putative FmdB family regulatory protein